MLFPICSIFDRIPNCLQKRYDPPNNLVPFIIQQITHQDESAGKLLHIISNQKQPSCKKRCGPHKGHGEKMM